ncbi:MAG TPA: hypothetical protein VFP04_06350, partial [Nitrospira sp.]|nr:hypothetical protein [Nitrospira sp.]
MPASYHILRSPWLIRLGLLGGLAVALLIGTLVLYGAYLATFLELPKSEDHPPLRLYTAPFQLKSGLSVKVARLPDRLQRLGYRPVSGPVG